MDGDLGSDGDGDPVIFGGGGGPWFNLLAGAGLVMGAGAAAFDGKWAGAGFILVLALMAFGLSYVLFDRRREKKS